MDSRINLSANSTARGSCTGDAWGRRSGNRLAVLPTAMWELPDDETKHFLEGWEKMIEYGKRGLTEILFFASRRVFNECLYSLKWKNMVQEVRIKVTTHNKLVGMRAEQCIAKHARSVHVLSEQGKSCNRLSFSITF